MFKFYRDSSGAETKRGENLIGHDRFCTQKVAVPRYRRRRGTRRTQEEVDCAFELTSITSGVDDTPSELDGGPNVKSRCRKMSWRLKGNQSEEDGVPMDPKTGFAVSWDGSESESLCSLSRFLSSIGGMLGCGHGRKTSLKYDPSISSAQNGLGGSRDPLAASLAQGSLRLERATAHRICLKYLESRKDRYVLIDHLPSIGWRGNRLWYFVSDSTVRAERILTVTRISPRTHPHPLNSLLKACQALQHPYVCPILDLHVLEADNLGKKFVIVVTPVVNRGSLRDVFQRSDWSESWERKRRKEGRGLSQVQVQRLSCQVLEALLELRSKGIPPGLGVHLHPGNVLIQYGTARFSGLDNILFDHEPMKRAFLTQQLVGCPEDLDAVAFAHSLFSMCSGYEVTSPHLTSEDWVHVRAHPQVAEVLEFILSNGEGRIPGLVEISQLDFYRTLDLRELRAPPPSTTLISAPPVSAIHFLLEYLKANHPLRKGKKSKSICGITTKVENNGLTSGRNAVLPLNMVRRAYSSSTPSIPKAIEIETAEALSVNVPDELPSNSTVASPSSSSQLSVYWTPPNSLNC